MAQAKVRFRIPWLVRILVVLTLGACGTPEVSVLGPDDTLPLEDASAVVFLHADVTRDEIAEVEGIIQPIDADKIQFVDQNETYREFVDLFRDADLRQTITASDMPPSFRIWPAAALDDRIRELLNASQHVLDMPGHLADTEVAEIRTRYKRAIDPRNQLSIVYLKSSAGEEGKAEIETILSEVPNIYFVEQEQTLAEFWFFFEGDSEADDRLLETINVTDMPPSWRVDLDGGHLPEEVRAELETSRHVREITEAS